MFEKSRQKAALIAQTISAYELTLGTDSPKFQQLRACASNEHISHDVAYDLARPTYFIDPNDPPICEVYDDDGVIRQYRVMRLKVDHPGMYGFILTDASPDNPRLHIVFRGTKNDASLDLDLEYPSPGFETYTRNSKNLLNQINAALSALSYKPHNHIYVSGHSMGGSLSQMISTDILKLAEDAHLREANNEPETEQGLNFKKIRFLKINHANSTGVPHEIYAECRRAATYLAQNCAFKLDLYVVWIGGDPIQKIGPNQILHDLSHDVATITLMKINPGYEGWYTNGKFMALMTTALMSSFIGPLASLCTNVITAGYLYTTGKAGLAAHTSHHFKEQNAVLAWEMFDNQTAEGSAVISQKLSNLSMLFDNALMHRVKSFVKSSRSPSPTDPRHHAEWECLQNEPGKVMIPDGFADDLRGCYEKQQKPDTRQKVQEQKAPEKDQSFCIPPYAGGTLLAGFTIARYLYSTYQSAPEITKKQSSRNGGALLFAAALGVGWAASAGYMRKSMQADTTYTALKLK